MAKALRDVSLAHLTVLELEPPQVIEAAHRGGYDTADLRLAQAAPHDRIFPMFGLTAMLRETLQRLDDTGIRIFDVEMVRLRRDTDIASFDPLFDVAARLGARRLKVVGNDPDEAVVAERLAELCDRILPYGLTADIEVMVFADIRTPAAGARVVQASGRENAAVLVDALHLNRAGCTPDDLGGLDPALFGYVHLCDAPLAAPQGLAAVINEARSGRLLPGQGGLPLVALLRALPPGLPVSVEVPVQGGDPFAHALRACGAARHVIAMADGCGCERVS